MEPIDVKLRVQVAEGAVKAFLTFTNTSDRNVFLLKNIAFLDGPPKRRLFRIETAAGTEIPYVGPMVKRRPWNPDDFVRLVPGETINVATELQEQYDFPDERVHCEARYEAINPSRNEQELFEVNSNMAAFDSVGKVAD